jgi:hypothetical protein
MFAVASVRNVSKERANTAKPKTMAAPMTVKYGLVVSGRCPTGFSVIRCSYWFGEVGADGAEAGLAGVRSTRVDVFVDELRPFSSAGQK